MAEIKNFIKSILFSHFLLAISLYFALLGSVKAQNNNINDSLRTALIQMKDKDQLLRKKINSVQNDYGRDSEELKKLWENIHRQDSLHTAQLKDIVHEYGWPGNALVGPDGARSAFVIIQHSNLDSNIQEEFLPLLIEAAENDDFAWQYVAYLKDRILVYQKNEPQLYGTQVFFNDSTKLYEPFPIQDRENVNNRRKEVGLFSLEEYMKLYNK